MTQSLTGGVADKGCSWIDVGGEGKERNQNGFYVCSLGSWGMRCHLQRLEKWGLEQVTWKGAKQFKQ